MKFVCRNCEAFMLFEQVETVREASLGVTFACPKCGNRISMVTNPGETQLVHALGVKLGGRADAPQPLELTRETLKISSSGVAAGKCPFSNTVARMENIFEESDTPVVKWTPEAHERLKRVPEAVRSFVKTAVERIALQKGIDRVDEAFIDEAKDKLIPFAD